MPDQTDIHQRIAAIAAAHEADRYGPGFRCICGWDKNDKIQSEHIAEVLVSELGLTAEWALTSGGGRQTVMSERAAKDKAQQWPESFGAASRYVTAWEDQ